MEETTKGPKSKAKFGGVFEAECWGWKDENGQPFLDKDGKPEMRLKWKETTHNIVVDEGLDHILDVVVHGGTQVDPWYLVLFDNDFTPDGDETYATPGFTEITTEVDESTREEYIESAPSSQSVDNSSNKATYTFNSSLTVYGAALLGGGSAEDTKGDTAGGGVLLCAGRFTASRAVVDDDVINTTYTFGTADDGA